MVLIIKKNHTKNKTKTPKELIKLILLLILVNKNYIFILFMKFIYKFYLEYLINFDKKITNKL